MRFINCKALTICAMFISASYAAPSWRKDDDGFFVSTDDSYTPEWLFKKFTTYAKQQTPATSKTDIKRILCQEWSHAGHTRVGCYSNVTVENFKVTVLAEHADPIIGCPILIPKNSRVVIDQTVMKENGGKKMPLISFATGPSCAQMMERTDVYPVHKFYTSPLPGEFNILIFRPSPEVRKLKMFVQKVLTDTVMSNYLDHELKFS